MHNLRKRKLKSYGEGWVVPDGPQGEAGFIGSLGLFHLMNSLKHIYRTGGEILAWKAQGLIDTQTPHVNWPVPTAERWRQDSDCRKRWWILRTTLVNTNVGGHRKHTHLENWKCRQRNWQCFPWLQPIQYTRPRSRFQCVPHCAVSERLRGTSRMSP